MIHKLPPEVYKFISAGEVIESPASCIKELIENSIDAGAKNITVKIQGAGKRKIIVIDDGEGISADEMKIALDRYTTSKIKSLDDIKRIMTYGFRGEALYALCSVSRITLRSSQDSTGEGFEVFFEGGKFIEDKPVPHPKGTTVIVEDLFFNTPARRKFLSSDSYEIRKIIQTFISLALPNPHISFFLENENEVIYNLSTRETIKERIVDIFGEEFLKEMHIFYGNIKGIDVLLFISKKEHLLSSSVIKYFFVNKRPVIDPRISSIMNSVYSGKEKFPNYIIFLNLAPSDCDFNVHPRKYEVKFKKNLRLYWNLKKFIEDKLNIEEKTPFKDFYPVRFSNNFFQNLQVKESKQIEFGDYPIYKKEKMEIPFKNVFQLNNTFIFTFLKDKVIILDQHTAHEKVLYERLKERRVGASQRVLFPPIFSLDANTFKIYEEIKEEINKIGFSISVLSGRTLCIEDIPEIFRNFRKENFIELLLSLKEDPRKKDTDNLLKTLACKSAIKAGEQLDLEEMVILLDEIFSLQDPFFCPHGRPTMIQLSFEDLLQKFGR